MLTIHAGENTAASRRAYAESKAEYSAKKHDIYTLNDKTFTDLSSIIENNTSLFSDSIVIFAENVLNKKENRALLKKYLKTKGINIIIWDSKTDPRTLKSNFRNAKLELYTFPTTIWKFLDGLHPSNAQQTIQTLTTVLETTHETMVLYLMQRRAKDLLLVMAGKQGKRKLAPWQRNSMMGQAKKWDQKMLENFYEKLLDIEKSIKSGTIAFDIRKALDILIIFYLQ